MKNSEKLSDLLELQARVNAEIIKIKAQESKKKRSEETRKKLLIGSLVMSEIKNGQYPISSLLKRLELYLSHDRDRALFGLEPIEGKRNENTADGKP